MHSARIGLLSLAALFTVSCGGEEPASSIVATPPPVPQSVAQSPSDPASGDGELWTSGVMATVTERADGRFDIDYVFARPQTVLFFARSAGDYRIGAWETVTPGTRIERLNGFDALIFDAPLTQVSLIAQPRFVRPEGDYSPFVAFSDGGLALFTGQFELLPAADADEILALNGDIGAWLGDQLILGVRVRSDRRMVFEGEVSTGQIQHISRGGGAFVYLGDGDITEGRSYVGVLDRGLPDWVLGAMETDMEHIFSVYETRWERPLEERAVLYFAFGGYGHEGMSNKGGVLGSSIMLESSGAQLRDALPGVLDYLRWFFAHEIAHQFQNQAGQLDGSIAASWIHEGGANTMANALVAEMREAAGAAWLSAEYVQAYADCTGMLADGPLVEAYLRGRYDAFYACGSLIGLMAGEAAGDGGLYDIWRHMQSVSDATGQQMSDDLFFAAAEAEGAPADLVAQLRRIVEVRLEDPAAELRRAMDLAGLSADFNAHNELLRIHVR